MSYRLSDLLLFSEQTYLRQFELYNQWLSPAQWLFYVYGVFFLFSLLNSERYVTRVLFLLSAPFWLICSYGFVWQFYVSINWMAEYFIVVFIIQAVLILWSGIFTYPSTKQNSQSIFLHPGLLLWTLTLFVQPVLEMVSGRSWSQLSVFAVTPDSLSFVAISFMLILRLPVVFFLPSALWLLFSTMTYLTMHSLTAFFPAFALVIYLAAIFLLPLLPGQTSANK
ncbi:MAG: hypothetical protein GY744_12290 [Gammaproteobacteria bacterium]|nr:hypothetical protein [Gammaproteobacteria bacterium]